MSRVLSNLKSHFANWRQWEVNPIVVKELRQAVRSWAVTGTLLLFLLVLFCSAVMFFVTQSFGVSTNQRMGAVIFSTFSVILTGASLLFIPLYVGVRVAAERQESDLDLLYISTLTPQRIIRGKFFCGAYVAILFFSACMPFMTFTNLLRGVDLPSIFFVLLCLFLAVCCAVQVAIFLACLPISRLLKIFVGLIAGVNCFWMTGMLTLWTSEMMRRGVGSMMSDRAFWAAFLTVCGLVFAATLLLHFLSVALISPPSANRALPVRIYMTAAWVVGAAISFLWAKNQNDARLVLPWAIASFVLFGISLVVVVSNQDKLSLRVQRAVPERLSIRAVAFLFYNGAAGGLVWLASLAAITYFVTWGVLTLGIFSSTLDPDEMSIFLTASAASVIYGFAYALTGLVLHRRFFAKRSPKLAGIFAVIVPAVWSLVPVMFFFFMNRLSTRDLEHTQLGNLFNIYVVNDNSQRTAHLLFATGWLAVMLALNFTWFARQLKNFQPLRRAKSPPPAAVEAPPIMPAAVN
ncbi:MAG TPA: hypothetical protein VN873_09490 [Candidatus Angelobacter sp.]|nr:hypothetical protein [Candidatus Angelobacter sp.]